LKFILAILLRTIQLTMPIDILHTTISPCDNERRIFNEAISASKQGYRVAIIALKTPDLPASSQLNGIPVERIGIKKWQGGPLKFLSFNFKLFRRLLSRDFRILHCHDLWVLPASAAAVCWKGKKLVYDAHEYYRGLEIFIEKRVAGAIWAFTEWIFIKRADAVITINPYQAKLFQNCYSFLKAVFVLQNYPSLESLPSPTHPPGFREREKKAIFQGILKNGRALSHIIQAMEAVNSGQLEFIGHGEIEHELRELTVLKNLQELITFRGKMNWDLLLQETQKARAGLVLFQARSQNYAYASPNKFFEYVLTGTPVIASDLTTFKEFNAEFEVALLISPESNTDIAGAITTLLNNEDVWNRLHDHCLQARRKWNWEAQEKILLNIYQEWLTEK
jgi:glycosyltransferase involved in cell wall biosynthesis